MMMTTRRAPLLFVLLCCTTTRSLVHSIPISGELAVEATFFKKNKDNEVRIDFTDAKSGKTVSKKLDIPQSSKRSVPLEGATIPNEVFNLVKAIVGVGVLSLPAGIAAFGDNAGAVIPAVTLICMIGILSGYSFSLIGRVCAYTEASSYKQAWERSVGPSTSWIPGWSTTCKTFLAILAYSMVLADTLPSVLELVLGSGNKGISRTPTLLGTTVLILLPLCLKKDLASLAPFSLVGVLGMAYTAVAMAVRYFGQNYAPPDGNLLNYVPLDKQPVFGNKGAAAVFSPHAFILICMLSTAYMAHFNAPKFYWELRDHSVDRYNAVVTWSFGLSILLMALVTSLGFLTFGKASAGLVLQNYAPTQDAWMNLSRVAVAVSIVFSYPLAFVGCRDGMLDLLEVPKEERTNAKLNGVTVLLLTVVTLLAMVLKDLSFVLSFGGATLGNALIYVYPALMYRAVIQNMKKATDWQKAQVPMALSSAVLGIVMGAIGAKMAIEKLEI